MSSTDELTAQIGARVRQARLSVPDRQIKEVAAMTGIPASRISNWEVGYRRASLEDLKVVAQALGKPAAWLACLTDDDGSDPAALGYQVAANRYRNKQNEATHLDQYLTNTAYHSQYLEDRRLDAKNLLSVRSPVSVGSGTIRQGDELLIDRAQSAVRDSEFYALLVNGRIVPRYIRAEIKGGFTLLEHEEQRSEDGQSVTAQELQELEIIGRIVRVSRDR